MLFFLFLIQAGYYIEHRLDPSRVGTDSTQQNATRHLDALDSFTKKNPNYLGQVNTWTQVGNIHYKYDQGYTVCSHEEGSKNRLTLLFGTLTNIADIKFGIQTLCKAYDSKFDAQGKLKTTALVPAGIPPSKGQIALTYEQVVSQAQTSAIDALKQPRPTFKEYVQEQEPKDKNGNIIPCAPDRLQKALANYTNSYPSTNPHVKALDSIKSALTYNLLSLLSLKEQTTLENSGDLSATPMHRLMDYAMRNPGKIDMARFFSRYVGFIPNILSNMNYDVKQMKESAEYSYQKTGNVFIIMHQQKVCPWGNPIVKKFNDFVEQCNSAQLLSDYVIKFISELLNPNLFQKKKTNYPLLTASGNNTLALSSETLSAQQNLITSLSIAPYLTVANFPSPDEYANVVRQILLGTIARDKLMMKLVVLYLDSRTSSGQTTTRSRLT